MTRPDLDALESAHAKATAGEWYTGDDAAHPANVRIRSNGRPHIAKVYAADLDDHDQAERDATAIVALHNAYPALRAHIDAQAATIAGLRAALVAAEAIFAEYQLMHLDKGTADGDEKARRNGLHAMMCAAALNGAA